MYQGTVVGAGDPAENPTEMSLLSWNFHSSRKLVIRANNKHYKEINIKYGNVMDSGGQI